MSYTQDAQYISITSPLGKDKLLIAALHGEEAISEPFSFDLTLNSEDRNLDPEAIVGQSVTVAVQLSSGGKRYFNGIVTRFGQGAFDDRLATYYAEIRPWFWLLTMTRDCRIFQNQSVNDIISTLLGDLGFTDFRNDTTGSYDALEYCVQYEESAFDFISRLMEQFGIFYYWVHEDGKHTMVLADDSMSADTCPEMSEARYGSRRSGLTTNDDIVEAVTFEKQVVPGVSALDDFFFETPSTDLMVEVTGTKGDRRIYEYPGKYSKKDAGDKLAAVRMESREAPEKLLRGSGFFRAMTSGYKFTLKEHPLDARNADYVLWRVGHEITTTEYRNTFIAFPADIKFRPPIHTPRPRIAGSQTALVVGPSGEEIWTDKYGRIKLKFHWDQAATNDEERTCWVRVDQGWAGKQWGSFFLPRIGMEVIVTFLDGDPDCPLVTGAVYNSQQTVPYGLTAEQTKSTIKTQTTPGGGGSNELRFEDKSGSEEIFVHAQKDMNIEVENDRTKKVLNDETNTITNNRKTTVEEGNYDLIVSTGNRGIKVDTGNETHDVKGTRTLNITGDETHNDKANFTQDVKGNYDLTVGGNLTINVTGTILIKGASVTTKADGAMTSNAGGAMTITTGSAFTCASGSSLTMNAAAAMTLAPGGACTVNAGGALTINAGGTVTTNAATQILQGALINVKGALKIG